MADKGVTVLFLGSGFSKAIAGVPIQDRFLKHIFRHNEHCDWVDGYGLDVGKSSLSDWFKKLGDIEACMSHLHNIGYSPVFKDPKRRNAQDAIITFRTLIAERVKSFRAVESYRVKFVQWLEKLRKENDVKFLTTNYDLVLERILGVYSYPKIPLAADNLPDEASGICKLHGSINSVLFT